MGTGSIRLSSEVARPAQAPSSAATARERTGDFAAFANSMAAAAARDNPFAGMGERLNNTAQRVAHGLNQWARRRADEISHETAQKVQAKMSEFSLSLYGRRELAADGVVDAWDAECQKALKEAGSELDPATRKVFEQRMSPWIAGRRENLMRHQFMEVRRGRVNELENDMAATAASETSDILALLGSEQADWSSRLASGTGEEVIAAEKAKAFETHYQQMLAVRADAESRYADAAEQGLYGAEEARARCLKSRHDAAKTIVASAIESGCEDFAEYVLDRLQPKPSQIDPPQAGGSGRGSAPSLPAPAQPDVDHPDSPAPSGVDNTVLSADEVASLRSAVGRARERKAAEARRAEAQRVRDLCEEADKREFEILKTPMPDDLDGYLSQSEITACEYDELANDDSLPLAYRRKYLSTAASIRSSAARAAAAADKAQADEQAAAEKARAAVEKSNAERGYIDPSGNFHPAWQFPRTSDPTALDEFDEHSSSVWQNPRTAMARLAAARMTGRLKLSDYKRFSEYAAMLMDEKARTWWDANYSKLNLDALQAAAYGEADVSGEAKKARKRLPLKSAAGIFAADRGVKSKSYATAADFVADSLSKDDAGESIVPLDALPQLYSTIRRLARAGVDPADAARQLLQPSIREGLSRTFTERLTDPEYFDRVVGDFLRNDTAFTAAMTERQAQGRGGNWYADRNQAVTSDLVRQKRVTTEKRQSK